MTDAQRSAERFNDAIAEQTRHAIEDGISCCGAHYWTEGDEHDPACPERPAALYGADVEHEALPLFVPAPEQLPGQLDLDAQATGGES